MLVVFRPPPSKQLAEIGSLLNERSRAIETANFFLVANDYRQTKKEMKKAVDKLREAKQKALFDFFAFSPPRNRARRQRGTFVFPS